MRKIREGAKDPAAAAAEIEYRGRTRKRPRRVVESAANLVQDHVPFPIKEPSPHARHLSNLKMLGWERQTLEGEGARPNVVIGRHQRRERRLVEAERTDRSSAQGVGERAVPEADPDRKLDLGSTRGGRMMSDRLKARTAGGIETERRAHIGTTQHRVGFSQHRGPAPYLHRRDLLLVDTEPDPADDGEAEAIDDITEGRSIQNGRHRRHCREAIDGGIYLRYLTEHSFCHPDAGP